MKNLLKVICSVSILLLVFSACVSTGSGGGSGGGAAPASVTLIPATSIIGWNPMNGGLTVKDGVVNFTGILEGSTYKLQHRYAFTRRADLSAFPNGFLQMDMMVSDIQMMDNTEATIHLASGEFNYAKWNFGKTGSFDEGLSPQIPDESGVWTTVFLPLWANSWKDNCTENGYNLAKIEGFQIFMSGIPVEGTISIRNIKVVSEP